MHYVLGWQSWPVAGSQGGSASSMVSLLLSQLPLRSSDSLLSTVTIGGASLFLIFGVIYLYESLSGAALDLSPISAANAPLTSDPSLPPEALAAMKQPYLPNPKAAAEGIAKVVPRSIIHSMYQSFR